jgi:hypothetical protein
LLRKEMDPEIQAKLALVTAQAITRFSRPGTTRGTARPAGVPRPPSKTDPRLLDYIYEVVFSLATAPPAAALGGKNPSLDDVRSLVFTLQDFKAAANRVAYSEDLLTRAVSLLEGMSRCRLCGSNNTTLTTRQMHSSDEAPTMMLYCGSCNHHTTQTGE